MKPIRQSIARIAVLALLLNAFLPFVATYDAERVSAQSQESSFFGGKVLLCTAEGFKWVKVADLQSGKTPRSHYQCPLCYLAAHGLAHVLPQGINVALSAVFPTLQIAGYDYRPVFSFLTGAHETRAPPSMAA